MTVAVADRLAERNARTSRPVAIAAVASSDADFANTEKNAALVAIVAVAEIALERSSSR